MEGVALSTRYRQQIHAMNQNPQKTDKPTSRRIQTQLRDFLYLERNVRTTGFWWMFVTHRWYF